MKFARIEGEVGDVPFISRQNAKYLYDLILEHRLADILELGVAHGTATCYMAAAVEELGRGHVTAVDLIAAAETFRPSAEEQLARTGLGRFAEVTRMQTGYTWFLHDEIVRRTRDGRCEPVYDLCIIDGPKNWTIDGAAFFFVDKLLKPNGWIVFDDYDWTYAAADARREATDGISHRLLSDAERRTPQIRDVFELLVKQHPSYSRFKVFDTGDWAMAQKVTSDDKTYTVVSRRETIPSLSLIARAYYKARRCLRTSRRRAQREA